MNVAVAPVKMQRAEGEGRITVSFKGGRTRLDELYQSGAAKMRLPVVHDGTHAEAVLINVSGGLTGGDRFSWKADLKEATSLCVTTQACEKIYRTDNGHAEIKAQLKLEDHAALSWLPQEAILFDQSKVRRLINVEMAATSKLLILEAAIIGRAAFGETVNSTLLQDRWRIFVDGKLAHAEETKLDGDPSKTAAGPSRLAGATAFASLVLIASDAEQFLEPLRGLSKVDGCQLAVSHLPAFHSAKLVARFAAHDGLALRRGLIPAVELLNLHALKMGGLPKVWRL